MKEEFLIFIFSAVLTIIGNIYSFTSAKLFDNYKATTVISTIAYFFWCVTFLYILLGYKCPTYVVCNQMHIRLAAVFILYCFFIIDLFIEKYYNNETIDETQYVSLKKSAYAIHLTASILFTMAAFYPHFNMSTLDIRSIYGMSGSLLLLISSMLAIIYKNKSGVGIAVGMTMLIIQALILML